jgi:nitronate monooxygenase
MIQTRLTESFNLDHPIIQAPMAFAAGGALASSVTNSGGLGLIGGGYGDKNWILEQFDIASPARVGCGLITWSLKEKPDLISAIIEKNPQAIFLSFGDPGPFANEIRDANIPLICQIQTMADARNALDFGVDIIVAQGSEAGGHGEKRATFTLVPEVADLLSAHYPQALLCAAGGIADGRGLAAALMLGADGVVIGSRFWATHEALVHPNMHNQALAANGDMTIRSSVMDIAQHFNWPGRYTARVLENSFTDRWHLNIEELIKVADTEAQSWSDAWINGDTDIANTFVGEATGLVDSIVSVEECMLSIVNDAKHLLAKQWS